MGIIQDFGKNVLKNRPQLFLAGTILGAIGAPIAGAWGHERAYKAVMKTQALQRRELTSSEILGVSWKYYIPSGVCTALSVGCGIGLYKCHSSTRYILEQQKKTLQAAAAQTDYLGGALQTANRSLQIFEDEVTQQLGKEAVDRIKQSIAADSESLSPRAVNNCVERAETPITPSGDEYWMRESCGERAPYFKSNIEEIRDAVNQLNYRAMSEGDGTIDYNDFNAYMGLEEDTYLQDFGWDINRDGLLDVDFYGGLKNDKHKTEPYIMFKFIPSPHSI